MSAWVETSPGEWRHRPWWKVAINTCLRLVQPQPRKWVVFTRADERTQPPTTLGYGFGLVLHLGPPDPRPVLLLVLAVLALADWAASR